MMLAGRRFGIRRLLSDASGVTALEFAIVAPVFLTMIFVTLEISVQLLLQINLDHGVAAAGRDVMIGNISNTTDNARTNFVAKLCQQAFMIPDCTSAVSVQLLSGATFQSMSPAYILPNGQLSGGTFNPPGTGQAALIQVSYPMSFPVPFGIGTPFLISQMALQAEPY